MDIVQKLCDVKELAKSKNVSIGTNADFRDIANRLHKLGVLEKVGFGCYQIKYVPVRGIYRTVKELKQFAYENGIIVPKNIKKSDLQDLLVNKKLVEVIDGHTIEFAKPIPQPPLVPKIKSNDVRPFVKQNLCEEIKRDTKMYYCESISEYEDMESKGYKYVQYTTPDNSANCNSSFCLGTCSRCSGTTTRYWEKDGERFSFDSECRNVRSRSWKSYIM